MSPFLSFSGSRDYDNNENSLFLVEAAMKEGLFPQHDIRTSPNWPTCLPCLCLRLALSFLRRLSLRLSLYSDPQVCSFSVDKQEADSIVLQYGFLGRRHLKDINIFLCVFLILFVFLIQELYSPYSLEDVWHVMSRCFCHVVDISYVFPNDLSKRLDEKLMRYFGLFFFFTIS